LRLTKLDPPLNSGMERGATQIEKIYNRASEPRPALALAFGPQFSRLNWNREKAIA
jgi:hypothetical protein